MNSSADPHSIAIPHTRFPSVVVAINLPPVVTVSFAHAVTVPPSFALTKPVVFTATLADPPPTVSTAPETIHIMYCVGDVAMFTVFLLARTTASPSANVPVPLRKDATGSPCNDHEFGAMGKEKINGRGSWCCCFGYALTLILSAVP